MSSLIIHPDMGKGHSNIPESAHSVLTHYRAKDTNIQNLHYIVSTNMGLLDVNSTFMGVQHEAQNHWIIQLYEKLGLPIFPAIVQEARKHLDNKLKRKKMLQSADYKTKKSLYKQARSLEQEERKKWNKRQAMQHSYGDSDIEDDGDDDGEAEDDNCGSKSTEIIESEEMYDGNVASNLAPVQAFDDGATTSTASATTTQKLNATNSKTGKGQSRKKCKCGSDNHSRTSHSQCRLNKKFQSQS